jgi:hypothetical protein
MQEPSKEQREEVERRKAGFGGPNTQLACWLLETLAKEDNQLVHSALYQSSSLNILARYIEVMPSERTAWVVNMLTSMLQELHKVSLDPSSVREIHQLGTTLTGKATSQYQAEQSKSETDKSQLLQSLVQAAVVVETTVKSSLRSLRSSSPLSPTSGIVALEHKEEDTLLESKDGSDGEPVELRWSPDACGKAIETVMGRRGIRKAPRASGQEYSVALGNIGYSSGKHKFNVSLTQFTGAGPIVGIAVVSVNLNGTLGTEVGTIGWGMQKLYACGQEVPFGPKFSAGDVISVEVDISKGTVAFYRNSALVGLAVGPTSSNALVKMQLEEGPLHPAVALMDAGDEVYFIDDTDDESLLATGDTEMPSWFHPIREAVELLRSCARRELPTSILSREFLPTCQKKASVVLESGHPYDGSVFEREVRIPGASHLELHFDPQTIMGPKDVIAIEGLC